ncbi:MAG: methyltransferase domain-containing protein [Gemmataceae bacterium]
MDAATHEAVTIDQFTRQAVPFARLPGHATSLDLLVRLCRAVATDHVLDVACGPGLVACHFAPHVAHLTGLDLTPEMIRQAEQAQTARGLTNLTWRVGTADPLPFPDASFSLVLTRYSFHHFRRPAAVLAEMVRVCRPGGRVLVADVALPADKVDAYDALERLRDPSHVHALSRDEFAGLFAAGGLSDVQFAEYKVELELEAQLAASFPVADGADRIRTLVRADVGVDQLGIGAHRVGEALHYAVPIVVAVGTRPA